MNPNLHDFLRQHPCPYDFHASLFAALNDDEEENGLIAMGGDLKPSTLILAYSQGIFPWFNEGEPIAWWSPEPRCVIYPADFTASKTLQRRIKNSDWTLRVNSAFEQVINACSEARTYSQGTWISPEMIVAYNALHQLGFAHSVEIWDDATLIGGLYGLKLGQSFFGESMFHRATDASKVAFFGLMKMCEVSGFHWVDCQLPNNHLLSLGAVIMPREQFLSELSTQVNLPSCDWSGLVGKKIAVKDLLGELPITNHQNHLAYLVSKPWQAHSTRKRSLI